MPTVAAVPAFLVVAAVLLGTCAPRAKAEERPLVAPNPFGTLSTKDLEGAAPVITDQFRPSQGAAVENAWPAQPTSLDRSLRGSASPRTVPPTASASSAALASMPAEDIRRLKEKARGALGIGGIAAARTLLEEPTMFADPEVLFLLAETYDPQALSRWGAVGVGPDPVKAAWYYGQAFAGGYVPQRRGEVLSRQP